MADLTAKLAQLLTNAKDSISNQYQQGETVRQGLAKLLSGDTSPLNDIYGQVKQLGNPNYMKQVNDATGSDMQNIALNANPMMAGSIESKVGNILSDFSKVNIGGRDVYKNNLTGSVLAESKFPSGLSKWQALDHKIETSPDGSSFEFLTPYSANNNMYDSPELAFNSIKGQKISAAITDRNNKLYGNIPKTWSGDAKRTAKEIIDAGHDVSKFSSSTQSNSKYIELANGQKIRMSDHELPEHYDSPDIEYRYGGDKNDIFGKINKINEQNNTIGGGLLGANYLKDKK